jgi:hypothetical protein
MRLCGRWGKPLVRGERAFREIFDDSVGAIPTISATLHVVATWDSGPGAGMDCQVEVRGSYPAGWRAICENGKAEARTVKEDDIQEVLFWHAYYPPDKGIDRIYIVDQDGVVVSDLTRGFGWLVDTNHRHAQRIVLAFAEVPGGSDPGGDGRDEPPHVDLRPALKELQTAINAAQSAQTTMEAERKKLWALRWNASIMPGAGEDASP